MSNLILKNDANGIEIVSPITNSPCETDKELDSLTSLPGTRSILYLISHDESSYKLGMKFANCKGSWIKPFRIHSTPFFESVIYTYFLELDKTTWSNVDYIITGTYKTVAKQLHYNSYTQNLQQIKDMLKVAKEGDYDVVPFLRSGSGTMSFCTYFHGKGFKLAWDALLTELGYSLEVIRSLDETKAFYRNIYIMKPNILWKLSQFMNKAMNIVTNNETIRLLFEKDAHYKEGSAEVSKKIFGTPYYQMHPFVFERLPAFFIRTQGFKMCHGPDDKHGPCKYNS